MKNPNSLANQIALVTGAGNGIGAQTAISLAEAGADIIINDVNADAAQRTLAQVEKLGRKTHLSTHDVSSHQAAHDMVTEATGAIGAPTILVNNAGITRDSMLAKLKEDKWDEVININLKGPFNVMQACFDGMKAAKYGRVVNLSSVAWKGNIGQTNYAASKAGVVGLTRTWAVELARYGVTVNAIAPGFVKTALTDAVPEEIIKKFIGKIPAGRIGEPADIANAILFLVNPAASYITGQVLHVDGGLTTGIAAL